MKIRLGKEKVLRCSFCSKREQDIKMLIAGPKVHICDACVDICNRIIAEHKAKEASTAKTLEQHS